MTLTTGPEQNTNWTQSHFHSVVPVFRGPEQEWSTSTTGTTRVPLSFGVFAKVAGALGRHVTQTFCQIQTSVCIMSLTRTDGSVHSFTSLKVR